MRGLIVKAWRTVLGNSAKKSSFISLDCAANSPQKNQRGSDKHIANERTADSSIETAMGVDCALIVFSGCELSFCNRGIESAFTSANSTNLSVTTADSIFGDALPTSLVDSPRLERVIELSKLVPSSSRMPDRKAMNGTYFPEPYATRARKRDARVLEFATVSCFVCLISSIYLLL